MNAKKTASSRGGFHLFWGGFHLGGGVSLVFYSLTVDMKIHTSTKLLISNLTPESFSPAAVGRNSTGLLRNFRLHFLIEAFCEALSSLVK